MSLWTHIGYARLAALLAERAGLHFAPNRQPAAEAGMRRVLQAERLADPLRLAKRAERDPEVLAAVLAEVTIGETYFFREPGQLDVIRDTVLPALRDRRSARLPLRVWSAGCATGEEAYALVILLAEALGAERAGERVRVYATDREEAALARARSGVYTDREVEGVPAGLRERYFESGGGRHLFRRDLRRCLVFGRNDLSRDAPISGVDLLVCRNVLMYFQAEAQARILGRFHFALRDGGLLFLGSAEMLPAHAGPFRAVDLRARIFAKP